MKRNKERTDIVALPENDSSVKSISREILRVDMKALKLCLAILFALASAIMPLVIYNAVLYTFDIDVLDDGMIIAPNFALILSALAFMAVFVFVTLPVIAGVYAFAKRIVSDEKASGFIEIFSAFSKGKYWNSIILSFVIIIRASIIILPCVGGIVLVPTLAQLMYAADPIMIAAVSLFIIFACIAALVVAVYFASFIYFVPDLVLSKGSFKGVFAASVRLSEDHRKDIMKNILSFWWLVILSVLSLGILFIVYVAPLMLTSYFVFCKELTDNNY